MGSVVYTAPAYDTLRFYTHADAQCADSSSARTRRVICAFAAPPTTDAERLRC